MKVCAGKVRLSLLLCTSVKNSLQMSGNPMGMCRKVLTVCGVLFLSLPACSTLSVVTTPAGAEVWLRTPETQDARQIGITPYWADSEAISELSSRGAFALEIRKTGYASASYLVPQWSKGDLTIRSNLQPVEGGDAYDLVNRSIKLILRAERQILEKDYVGALATTSEIKSISDLIVAAHALEGTVYFLRNEMERSRSSWMRVIQLDPTDREARRMKEEVDKKLNLGSARGVAVPLKKPNEKPRPTGAEP